MFANDSLITFKPEDKPNLPLRAAGLVAGGATFVAAHRWAMRSVPNFAEKAYKLFSNIEERSPNRILRTFGLSELYSSYLPQAIEIPRRQLFFGSDLSPMGEHLQRMLGKNLDLRGLPEDKVLRFLRSDSGSAYMKLEGAEHVRVRFFKADQFGSKITPGRLAGASQRLGAPLKGKPFSWFHPETIAVNVLPKGKKDTISWITSLSDRIHHLQRPSGVYPEVLKGNYIPGSVQIAGKPLRNVAKSAELVSFEMGERAQNLLSEIRLGLWGGTYNRLAHVPFFGGKSKGLLNELLLKRALPIYLGAIGLGYADYLTHHAVSNSLIDFYQQARIAHAELTDHIPFARKITDAYADVVPGAQYGPLALPLAGATTGAAIHLAKVVSGELADTEARRISATIRATAKDIPENRLLGILNRRSPIAKGLLIGTLAMLPFLPGMLGSRKSAEELRNTYSGEEPVPVRSGRWWDLGTTPWEGNRIKEYRPHWTVLHKSQAEKVSLYGSEKEYWRHHPILHPLKYLRDPYWLEKKHYEDRPYPITSPAFSNVPLVGPLLAATIGKLVKPPVRMHPEWSGDDYSIGSTLLQPRGPNALPPAQPRAEFGLKDAAKRETLAFSELIGLPGFISRTIYGDIFPNRDPGKDVYFQGSRMMESASRRYYEKELGAGFGPDPSLVQAVGYTEPLRRFIQPEPKRIEVNEIANSMPSWLPGEDYFLNFKVGDPFAKVSEGYARLPGAGYESLHPEVAGLDAEDYPDLTKMSILGDVAPYSVEYRRIGARVRQAAQHDMSLRIEYEKIEERVKKMKESVVRTDDRRFSEEISKTKATVNRVTREGIELSEYPGRKFSLSSVGYSAADQSAIVLGEHNLWSKSQIASEVDNRQRRIVEFFNNRLAPGTAVEVSTPIGALENQENIQAVFDVNGTNVNKELITEGLGVYRKDLGGPESQAMFGWFSKKLGTLAENLSFTGDESRLNPLRYIPTPYHSKLWQHRTALSQYEQQEVEGARLRRWQHPLEDFLMPYARGTYRRVVGDLGVPKLTQKRRDLNTLTDMLEYVRDLKLATKSPELHGRYTSKSKRTAVGSDTFGSPTFLASTLSGRDSEYFRRFLEESDPNERNKILSKVPAEMARALSTQWVANQADIARASGAKIPALGEGGRLYTEEGLEEYSKSDTQLNYGDFQRSKEVAEFFTSKGLNLPDDPNSPLYDPNIDYEDVKLKIVQQEGYDMHDFGLFDDRAAVLWRKPYIDGAVRELTGPDRKSVEQVRKAVEELILTSNDKNPQVMITSNQANRDRGNVRVDVDIDQQKQLLKDMRRNPEAYQ